MIGGHFEYELMKIPEKEAFRFCEENRMKLWYPSQPFENVTDVDRKLTNLFSYRNGNVHSGNVLFWSSLKRKNITHFETPINEIVLRKWIEIENGEKRNVSRCMPSSFYGRLL